MTYVNAFRPLVGMLNVAEGVAMLNGVDASDDPTLDFTVIAYRGAVVASRDGWVADAKARGGVITQVPGGFFHDIEAARFGSSSPYVYELPPVWLLVWDGVDVAADEFNQWVDYQGIATAAANQMQGVADLVAGAGNVVTAIPDLVKFAAIGILGLVALNALSFVRKGAR